MNKDLKTVRPKEDKQANDIKTLLQAAKAMQPYVLELLKRMKREDEQCHCRY